MNNMKTEQQKAEAYVREKLPELMELSFGCWVEYNNKQYVFINDWERGTEDDKDWTLNLYSPIYDANNEEYHAHISKKEDEYDIIGHPIQLQHWLRVMGELYSVDGGGLVWHFTPRSPFWRIERHTMKFDLTTGQPATEADYKAINEVFGI